MTDSPLISKAYLEEQKLLHAKPEGYGGKGRRWAPAITSLLLALGERDGGGASLLDYGAGQATLAKALSAALPWLDVRSYDPAVPSIAHSPDPARYVSCTDVLEHIEPDRIDAVMADIGRLAQKALFLVIALTPTTKTLSDGRQAHILLKPESWWREKFEAQGWRFRPLAGSNPSPEKQLVAYCSR